METDLRKRRGQGKWPDLSDPDRMYFYAFVDQRPCWGRVISTTRVRIWRPWDPWPAERNASSLQHVTFIGEATFLRAKAAAWPYGLSALKEASGG